MSNVAEDGEELIHEVGLIIRIPIRFAQEIEFGDCYDDYNILSETSVGETLSRLCAILEQELGPLSKIKVVVNTQLVVGDIYQRD